MKEQMMPNPKQMKKIQDENMSEEQIAQSKEREETIKHGQKFEGEAKAKDEFKTELNGIFQGSYKVLANEFKKMSIDDFYLMNENQFKLQIERDKDIAECVLSKVHLESVLDRGMLGDVTANRNSVFTTPQFVMPKTALKLTFYNAEAYYNSGAKDPNLITIDEKYLVKINDSWTKENSSESVKTLLHAIPRAIELAKSLKDRSNNE